MDPVLIQARSDAEAIMACLGPLAIFAMQAEQLVGDGAMLADEPNKKTKAWGAGWRDKNAAVLRDTRERLDAVMQDFGDFFNNHDACTHTIEKIVTPVFDLLRQRSGMADADAGSRCAADEGQVTPGL